MATIKVGGRIREMRNRANMSIRELAKKVGLSYLTMQRIETDKLSPSVVLLSQIASCLNSPITSFLTEESQSVWHIKAENQNVINTKQLMLKLVAPKGALSEDISIVYGKAMKGRFVNRHKHQGFELAYVIKGRAIHKLGTNITELKEGDLIVFNASQPHEVIALETHEFLGIQFYSKVITLNDIVKSEQGSCD
jgi:transcriptional regulator with XRE-family HTH domain